MMKDNKTFVYSSQFCCAKYEVEFDKSVMLFLKSYNVNMQIDMTHSLISALESLTRCYSRQETGDYNDDMVYAISDYLSFWGIDGITINKHFILIYNREMTTDKAFKFTMSRKQEEKHV